jgi:tRNA (cmo5U34)-methyltransferase
MIITKGRLCGLLCVWQVLQERQCWRDGFSARVPNRGMIVAPAYHEQIAARLPLLQVYRMGHSSEQQDRLYAEQRQIIERFSFDDQVVRVFPDMIRRSVPGYGTMIEMIGVLAARYARPGTRLYDLGCSLGAASLAMAAMVPHRDCRIMAIDNSAAMIARARQLMDEARPLLPVELTEQDIRFVPLENASVVVLNFTLQFLPLADRDELVRQIGTALQPGDILVLSEKIRFEDADEDALQQALHHAFKRNNGYSDLEISQKRTALENVLIPETLAEHERRLANAGFRQVHVWFRCFNFLSLVAVR